MQFICQCSRPRFLSCEDKALLGVCLDELYLYILSRSTAKISMGSIHAKAHTASSNRVGNAAVTLRELNRYVAATFFLYVSQFSASDQIVAPYSNPDDTTVASKSIVFRTGPPALGVSRHSPVTTAVAVLLVYKIRLLQATLELVSTPRKRKWGRDLSA